MENGIHKKKKKKNAGLAICGSIPQNLQNVCVFSYFFLEYTLYTLFFKNNFFKNNSLRFFGNLEQLRTNEPQMASKRKNNAFFNRDKDWAFKKKLRTSKNNWAFFFGKVKNILASAGLYWFLKKTCIFRRVLNRGLALFCIKLFSL